MLYHINGPGKSVHLDNQDTYDWCQGVHGTQLSLYVLILCMSDLCFCVGVKIDTAEAAASTNVAPGKQVGFRTVHYVSTSTVVSEVAPITGNYVDLCM